MWKALTEWLLTLLNMTRETNENRVSIREQGQRIHELEQQVRSMEGALKLFAQELRHSREMESAEREKFLLQMERELAKLKESPRGKKNR
jgi:hypothetical protein